MPSPPGPQNDIWAAGDAVIHYDGTKWTAIKAPNIGSKGTLNGVADIFPTEVWAVGTVNLGMANPRQIIERWAATSATTSNYCSFSSNTETAPRGIRRAFFPAMHFYRDFRRRHE